MGKDRMDSVKCQKRGERSFDPTSLGGPVAIKTEWDPVGSGHSNFNVHTLREVSPQRVEFRPTIKVYLASAVFLMLGILILSRSPQSIGLLLPAAIFFGTGALMMYFGSLPFVFDKQEGYLWKGRKKPESGAAPNQSTTKIARIDEVHAIQLLYERVRKNKTNGGAGKHADMYEINIVTNDGSRVPVVRHGDLERLLMDAEKLGPFLGKPVWNAIQ